MYWLSLDNAPSVGLASGILVVSLLRITRYLWTTRISLNLCFFNTMFIVMIFVKNADENLDYIWSSKIICRVNVICEKNSELRTIVGWSLYTVSTYHDAQLINGDVRRTVSENENKFCCWQQTMATSGRTCTFQCIIPQTLVISSYTGNIPVYIICFGIVLNLKDSLFCVYIHMSLPCTLFYIFGKVVPQVRSLSFIRG